MASLKYFTPKLKWLSVVADAPESIGGDADADPDTNGIYGGCTVTPQLRGAGAGDVRAIKAAALTPSAALLALAPFESRLDAGDLKRTATQRLRLVAECPALALPAGVHLAYRFDFHDVTYNAQPQLLPSIIVLAPEVAEDHSDDDPTPGASEVELDLVTATWLPV